MMDDEAPPSAESPDEEPSEASTGLVLTPLGSDEPAIEGELVPRSTNGLLAALRADLAPLVPPIRRAATVVAVAAITDWAVRIGSRRLLREGLGRLTRQAAPIAPPRQDRILSVRSETVIVERLIIHRSG